LGKNAIKRELKKRREAVGAHPALTLVEKESQTIGGFGRSAYFSYQLLCGVAATPADSRAVLCVFLVYEFLSEGLNAANLHRSERDLQAFVSAVPAWNGSQVLSGQLLPSIALPGAGLVNPGSRITIGKLQTTLC
jgi:hypothetical protein